MSNPHQPGTVGSTLTGGIQDISAILPLIGTEQCEKHVGSALAGGYLYAAAAPLSIFGSLGIVKAGISILISSISIPKISISLSNSKLSLRFSQDSIWLGARMLNDAGFQLPGTVAPLMAMDGTRFKAESRLIQILEEKHIDNPEDIQIEWKSRQWNIMLVLSTIVAAAISCTPYIAILLGSTSWRPLTHTPWIFPMLRTVGSCLATICCQFLIQSRVILSMKNRILFMTIHRRFADNILKNNKANLDPWLKEHFQWDGDFPAEQGLWSLEQLLSSGASFIQPCDDPNFKKSGAHVSITVEATPPKPLFDKDFKFDYSTLQALRHEYFPTPTLDRLFALISWITLCVSLPAAVAGYIGCFTLVSASPGNGPLIWIGLEAALSIFRILVWASNPSFDEETDITVKLRLAEHQPLVTTEDYNPYIHDLNNQKRKPFALVPERQFLEWITPYTGPLDQFRNYENFALYFTLTANYQMRGNSDGNRRSLLLLTVFDFNKRNAVTLLQVQGIFQYFDATAIYNPISTEMEANLQSVMNTDHPRRKKDANLFDALAEYYNSIMWALNRTDQPNPIGKATYDGIPTASVSTAKLQWKWNLLPVPIRSHSANPRARQGLALLTEHDLLYLDRGYEHQTKTKLIDTWSRWIIEDLNNIQSEARNDCHEALSDATGEKAKWEFTELDWLLGWEWTKRELVALVSSIILEDILRERMKKFIIKVSEERKNGRLKEWVQSEFEIGRRKRLEKERAELKEGMERGMKQASERAEREGRSWIDQGRFEPQWRKGFEFIDKKWSAGIDGGCAALKSAMSELEYLVKESAPNPFLSTKLERTRLPFVGHARERFAHWHPQHEYERHEMDATIQRIRDVDGLRKHLDIAYKYPEPDGQATCRFVTLRFSTSKGKACSANVYDVGGCDKAEVCDVIEKTTTRSVINVDPKIVASIPENDHLLFLSRDDGKGEEPAFIQRNRDRWWEQQTSHSNSSMFYFSPGSVISAACIAISGPIAHIFIFLTASSRVRLRFLHYVEDTMSVSIQQDGKELRRISNEIPENLRLQDFELDEFEPGMHQLEVVAVRNPKSNRGWYYLRDILVEFFNDLTPDSSADEDDGDRATTIEDRGVDAESSGSEESISTISLESELQ